MRRGGIITERRRMRERGKRIKRAALTAGLVLLICALAMSDSLKERIAEWMDRGIQAAYTFGESGGQSIEVCLDAFDVYALQMGVFDDSGRAEAERQRLAGQGVMCAVWQREKSRLICSVAPQKELLNIDAAGGLEAYVIRDTLESVRLRLSCDPDDIEAAAAFVRLPDAMLMELMNGAAVDEVAAKVRWHAEKAATAHPENAIYSGLAQGLLAWCDAVQANQDENAPACFAAVSLCTICREWRRTLTDYGLSAESTASAQRTPSTAADVMPPAYPAPSPQG